MNRKLGMVLPLLAAMVLVLVGCAGPFNLAQKSIYHDDVRIAQEADSYSVLNSRGSIFERHLGKMDGLETLLRLSVPEKGGALRIDYDVALQAGAFKLVFVDGKDVDTVCEGSDRGNRTFTLEKGAYALKAVGASASADIALRLHASEGVAAVTPGGVFDKDLAIKLDPLESR